MNNIFLVIVALLLVALNGFFVAAEFGLVKLRQTRVRAIAKGIGFVLTRSSAPPLPVEGELTVESDPPGASLVVDGMASKVTTPGTLRMLGFDQDIHVRVEKEGREPREVTVRLTRQAASHGTRTR